MGTNKMAIPSNRPTAAEQCLMKIYTVGGRSWNIVRIDQILSESHRGVSKKKVQDKMSIYLNNRPKFETEVKT